MAKFKDSKGAQQNVRATPVDRRSPLAPQTPKVEKTGEVEELEEVVAEEAPQAGDNSTDDVPSNDDLIVTVSKAFNLRIDNHRIVRVAAGVQTMPRHMAEHWYSKANGVTVFEG